MSELTLIETLDTTDLLTLIALANLKGDGRKQYSPDQFFGLSEWVRDLIEKPVPTLQRALKSSERIDWDGIKPLWSVIIEDKMQRCAIDKASAVLLVDENNLRWAKKVLASRGCVSLGVLEKAQAIVLEAAEKVEKKVS